MARHSGRGGPRGFRTKRERVTQFLVLPGAVYALAGLAILAFGDKEINLERLKILVQEPALDGVTGLAAVASGVLVSPD